LNKNIIKYLEQQLQQIPKSLQYFTLTGLLLTISGAVQAREIATYSLDQTDQISTIAPPLVTKNISTPNPALQANQRFQSTLAQLPTQGQPNSIIFDRKPIPNSLPPTTKSLRPHRFYIGPDLFYRTYNEIVPPPLKSNEFGTLYGAQATYDHVQGNSIYTGLGLRYGGGTTTYDGSTQTGTPLTTTTNNQFLNAEGRLGYTFSLDQQDRFLVSPFVGLGYHRWNRDIVTTAAATGILEKYSWGYVGPGIRTEYQASPQFDIGFNAQLMLMLGGRIDAEIVSPTTGQTFAGGGSLGNNLQYEIELPMTYHLSPDPNNNSVDLKFTPYYRSQDIGRGLPFGIAGASATEPASNTSVYGVSLGAQFNF
jgi:hypothetical protein